MKKCLFFIAFCLFFAAAFPQKANALGSRTNITRVADFQLESDASGYSPAPAVYNQGQTFTVSAVVRNDILEPRTTYGFMILFDIPPNGCPNSDRRNVPSRGGTDVPAQNPGISEADLTKDDIGASLTYSDGLTNFPNTNNRECQTLRAETDVQTFTLPAGSSDNPDIQGPTATITFSITLPSDIPSGYYQYDVGFGPWCEENWQSPDGFNDYACDSGLSQPILLAGFIRVVNTTPPTPPPPPAGLSASCPAPGTQATISWQAVDRATSYRIRVDNLADQWNGTCSSTYGDFCASTTSTSYSFPSMAGFSYEFWVHAVGLSGSSDASQKFRFQCAGQDTYIPPATPPPAPNPNCYGLETVPAGIRTVTVNQPVQFTAGYSLNSGTLYGGSIIIGQRGTIKGFAGGWGVRSSPATLQGSWTPTTTGTYDVLCRAARASAPSIECRGNNASAPYREAGQVACAGSDGNGATTTLTINVVNAPSAPGAPTLQAGQGRSNDFTNQSANPVLTPVSGNQSTQSGSNYHNDIAIRVQATPADTIRQYYVAFYLKGSAAQVACTGTEGLDNCLGMFKDRILNAPQNGFLLKFGRTTPTSNPPNKYWVWKDYAGWQELPSAGTNLNIPSDRAPLYKISRDFQSSPTSYKWYVTFDKSLGSKRFYTGVVAVNQDGKYSVRGEVTPTKLQP